MNRLRSSAEAARLLEDALVRSRRVLGDGHPVTGNILRTLAMSYQAMGLAHRAQKLLATAPRSPSPRAPRP
ncbi:tetratricopeptide repeat protein [Streptomyces sp. Act143]|uniref:tetratricopeptide repeat protein n=1 Tax=Streptomyces sp. Act143 TaxID=2200760 RepID=UPI0035C0CC1C